MPTELHSMYNQLMIAIARKVCDALRHMKTKALHQKTDDRATYEEDRRQRVCIQNALTSSVGSSPGNLHVCPTIFKGENVNLKQQSIVLVNLGIEKVKF
jgi:hypothetical protein